MFRQSPTENGNSKGSGELPVNINRRSFLKKTLGAGVVLGSAGYLVGKINQDKQKINDAEESPKSDLEQAQSKVENFVKSVNLKKVLDARKARKELSYQTSPPNNTEVALSLKDESGILEIINIPDVSALSRSVSADKGKGRYVLRVGEIKYIISLAEPPNDIGVANRFKVVKVDDKVRDVKVMAVRRARFSKSEKEYKEYVIYTPPSEILSDLEVVNSGKDFVHLVLDQAFEVLSRGVSSNDLELLKASSEICKRLAIVEHFDANVFRKIEIDKELSDKERIGSLTKVTKKVYAEYSLNDAKAFAYLASGKGAAGMMQIMPRTYFDIRTRLIERGVLKDQEISPDPKDGRRDPLISAIVSTYLCFDNYKILKNILKGMNKEDVELSLVCMYNGSPKLFRDILENKKVEKVESDGVIKKLRDKLVKSIKGKSPKKQTQKDAESVEKKEGTTAFKNFYGNLSPHTLKLLTHKQGKRLLEKGSDDERENVNYIKKYLFLKRLYKMD